MHEITECIQGTGAATSWSQVTKISRLDTVVVGWNTRGVAIRSLKQFCMTTYREFIWDIMLLQEFSDCWTPEFEAAADGHLVCCNSSIRGRRLPAIIVHADRRGRVLGPPIFAGRSLALPYRDTRFGALWLISSHLDSGSGKIDFESSLNDLHVLISQAPCSAQTVISVDANDSLGQLRGCSGVLGNHCLGNGGWKGRMFLNAMTANGAKLWNTLQPQVDGAQTCYYDCRWPAQQIDFMATIAGPRRTRCWCQARDSTATVSDHRPVILRLLARPAVSTATGPTRTNPTVPKPIGWKIKDHSYAAQLRETFEDFSSASRIRICGPGGRPEGSLIAFTDGHFKARFSNSRRRKPVAKCPRIEPTCGWAFGIYLGDNILQEPSSTIKEVCGPVTESSCDPLFLGAVRKSNNVAELTAAFDLGWWILGNHQQLRTRGHLHLCVYFDSLYTLRLIQHLFEPKANVTLANLTLFVWDSIRAMEDTSIEFGWVKGHSGCWGNERVDKLSKAGATLTEPCTERTFQRQPFMWNHEGFLQKMLRYLDQLAAEGWRLPSLPWPRPRHLILDELRQLFTQHRTMSAAKQKWPEAPPPIQETAEEVGVEANIGTRVSSLGPELIPTLSFTTKAISSVAAQCGYRPGRSVPKLKATDSIMVTQRELARRRAAETCPQLRHLLGHALVRLRSAITRINSELRCEHFSPLVLVTDMASDPRLLERFPSCLTLQTRCSRTPTT